MRDVSGKIVLECGVRNNGFADGGVERKSTLTTAGGFKNHLGIGLFAARR
jgi:hypothetical protein